MTVRCEPDFDQLTERERIELEQRFTDLRTCVRHLQASAYALSGHMCRPNHMLERTRISNELNVLQAQVDALLIFAARLPLV